MTMFENMSKRFISFLFFIFLSSALWAQTFTSLNGPHLGNVNDLVRATSGTLIAATDNGLYRSTDGGTTWTRFTVSIIPFGTATNFQVLTISASGLIYAASFQNIFTSSDDGASWAFLSTTGLTTGSVRKIKVAPNGNVWVVLLSDNTLYRANAAAPTTFNTINTFSSTISDLDIGPANQIVVSTQGNSAQVSTNNGLSFSAPASGLGPASFVYSVAINATGVIFALASNTIYRSTNNGVNYTDIKNNITDGFFFGFIETDAAGDVFVANNSSSKIYSVSAAGSLLAAPVWSSANYPAGTSISARAGVFQSLVNWRLGFFAYAVASTTDGGVSWTQTASGIKAYFGSAVTPRLFRSATNRLFMGWPGSGYFVSIDDGANWDLLNSSGANLDLNINGFVPGASNSIIGYGSGGIVRSTDNGQTWTNQSISPSHAYLTIIGTTLYSLNTTFAPSSLQRSTDNGITWINLPLTGLPVSPSILKLVSTTSALFVVIANAGADNGIYSINITTGACAKNTTIPITPTDAAVFGDNIVAISGASMAVSANAGTSWVSRTISQNVNRIWIADELNFYAQASVAGTFLISNTAGATWSASALGDATGWATDAIFTPQGFAYLAGSNMAVQKSTNIIVTPKAPTNLLLQSKSSAFAWVTWDDNTTLESGYQVETSVGDNTNYQLLFTTSSSNSVQNKASTTVTANPVTPTFVRVRAFNAAGNSAYSNEISITAIDNACSPPAADMVPNNRSWTATAVADPGFTPTNSGPFTSANATISISSNGNLTSASTPDIHYGMGISGFGSFANQAGFVERCGQTSMSSTGQFQSNGNGTWNPATKTLTLKWQSAFFFQPFKGTTTFVLNASDPIPAVPTLSGNIYSTTEILLSWTAPSFAASYDLERSLTSGSGFVPVITVNFPANTHRNASLTPGQTYYYRIRSKNATGNSAYSAELAIAPSSATVFRPVVNSISDNTESQQGAAWGDLDGDGDDDLAMPSFINTLGFPVPPVFYENQGNDVFLRRDLTVLADEITSVSRGVGIFDFDNDNDLDIIIPRSGSGSGASSILLVNNGNWDFTKTLLTETTPPGTGSIYRGYAISDFDQDGFADVFLGSPSGSGTNEHPLMVLKKSGSSLLVSTAPTLSSDLNSGMTILPADYDNDGDQDVYIINRLSPPGANRLYRNNGDGTFSLVTGLVFDSDLLFNSRTGSWGDIDNDGDLDLYVGNQTTAGNRLYRNNSDGTFTSLTSSVQEGIPATGSAFGDLDNDGDLDLVVTALGANAIYFNNGSGVFTKSVTPEIFTSALIANVGGAFSDYDADGFLDFYMAIASPAILPNLLYKNTLTASASRNWVEVKLKGTVSNRAAIGARVTVTTTSPNRTQIREVMAATGYSSQSSLTQHFGLGTATAISQIQIRWPNGGTQTIANPAINQVITITEDVVGPVLSLTPANGSAGVNTGNTLKVTLSELGSPVAAKNIVVRRDTGAGTVVQTLAATAGVATGNEYTYTLASNLLPLTTYFISIDAGAFIDVFGNPSLTVAPANWTFSTLDNVAPVVTFIPPATISKADLASQVFTVTATDNIAISSVVMSYRKITATQFQTLTGTFNASTGNYDFSLQASMFNDMGLEYYFEATDAQPNTTRNPTTGNYFTRLTISESLLTLSISAGSTLSAYKIISVPLDLSTNAVGSLFEELGAPDPKEWRLLKYVNSPPTWNETFQNIARGEGYFIISKGGANIKFGEATSPNYTQASPFVLNLTQGFNLIGNPYLVPINWNEVRSGIAGVGELKIFQGGVYANIGASTDLGTFEGGFVFANAAVSVPIKFKTSTGGRVSDKTIGSDISSEEWIVPIELHQGNNIFRFGGIGMSKDASLSYDGFDDFAPPALFENQELKFAHPEHFMKHFSRDVVPTILEYLWEFTVDTEVAGTAELKWDNTLFGDNANELYLVDVTRQVVTDMRTTNQFSFDPEKSTMFKIYFGKDLRSKVKPEGVFLGKPFPNPTNTSATIGFTLPENNSSYRVQLEIFNSVGQRTAILTNGNFLGGFYTSVWDIENNKNGLYFYRLTVSSSETQKVLTEKIIINR